MKYNYIDKLVEQAVNVPDNVDDGAKHLVERLTDTLNHAARDPSVLAEISTDEIYALLAEVTAAKDARDSIERLSHVDF